MDTSHKPKILYAEDDRTLAMLYGMRMEAEGWEVKHCEDGDTALQSGREFKPDLILLDLMMPSLNGFDAIDMFRNTMETSASKIIVLSALNQPEDIEKAKTLGADEYLVKSQVTIDEIIQHVRIQLGLPPHATAADTGASAV